jgi:hypothetical protein
MPSSSCGRVQHSWMRSASLILKVKWMDWRRALFDRPENTPSDQQVQLMNFDKATHFSEIDVVNVAPI